MITKPAFFSLKGEDAKLLEKIKKRLLSTDGKVSSIAVVRKALRKLDQDMK